MASGCKPSFSISSSRRMPISKPGESAPPVSLSAVSMPIARTLDAVADASTRFVT